MERVHVKHLAWVGVVTATLLAGIPVLETGASAKAPKVYSESDCEVIMNLQLDSDAGSGYYGKTATNASKVFAEAADEVEDNALQGSLNTLSDVWGDAGKASDATAAAAITVKAGKRYTKALKGYTKAFHACFEQQRNRVTSTDSTSSRSSSTTTTTEPEAENQDE